MSHLLALFVWYGYSRPKWVIVLEALKVSVNRISINLLGRVFTVSCPEGEEANLQAVAANLDDIMQQIRQRTHIHNREELAVMAALQLGYELSKEKNRNESLQNEMEQRILLLQNTLEQALVEHTRKAE